jgi:DNA-binding MarR family transcriptional regulator
MPPHTLRDKTVVYLRAYPGSSSSVIAKDIKEKPASVSSLLRKMEHAGHVRCRKGEGPRGGMGWYVVLDSKKLEQAAFNYARARSKYLHIYDQMDTVRGLDEFDPKHMAWETRLFNAEQAREKMRDILLHTAVLFSLGAGKIKGTRKE